MEKSTALPRPPPARRMVSLCGISVGVPVGPITTTGSPGWSVAQRRDEPPISRMISESRPRSGSVQAPVRAMPSITSLVPSITGAVASKFCRRKNCPGTKRRAAKGAPTVVALLLGGRGAIERLQLDGEERGDERITVPGRGHGLDDIAGIARVVVAIEGDELRLVRRVLVRGEKTVLPSGVDLDQLRR